MSSSHMPLLLLLEANVMDRHSYECLQNARIDTIESLLVCDLDVLVEKTGIAEATLAEVYKRCQELVVRPPVTADILYREEQTLPLLSFGCSNLDALFRGGLKSCVVHEIYGLSGSGKSLLCHNLALSASSTGQVALYIDSGSEFSALRMARLAHLIVAEMRASGAPLEASDEALVADLLSRVRRCVTCDAYSLALTLARLRALERHQLSPRIGVLIVDSFATIVTPLLDKHDSMGYSLVTSIGRMLQSVAKTLQLPVVLINHAQATGHKPTLGKAWLCVADTRLLLRRLELDTSDADALCSDRQWPPSYAGDGEPRLLDAALVRNTCDAVNQSVLVGATDCSLEPFVLANSCDAGDANEHAENEHDNNDSNDDAS